MRLLRCDGCGQEIPIPIVFQAFHDQAVAAGAEKHVDQVELAKELAKGPSIILVSPVTGVSDGYDGQLLVSKVASRKYEVCADCAAQVKRIAARKLEGR